MKLAADSCQLKLLVAWDWAGALPPCHKCICNWWPCMRNGQDSPERLEIVSGACQMALKWPEPASSAAVLLQNCYRSMYVSSKR